jgi:glycerophosphoryl diester phosphodiesterase
VGDLRNAPRVVAHRGLLRHAPENTLAAFRACLELRLGFELDVRRSRDGQLVCIHDATIDRTTDGRGNVADLTVQELKARDAGSWFDPAFRGERIPTIDEIFRLLAGHAASDVLVAVDMKDADLRIEADVVALAKKHCVLDRLVFIGRTIEVREVRQRLKAADKAARVARLAGRGEEFTLAVQEGDIDWVYVRSMPTPAEVQQAHRAGKKVFLAGPLVAPLKPPNWQTATTAGVDGILTDYPLALREALRGK